MDGVKLTPLKIIPNLNGNLFHGLKSSENSFCGFGEAYFSTIKKGSIKGWKKHTKMTLNIIVPYGEIRFVIYNEVSKSFFTVQISQKNYKRLTVNPGLFVAFQGIGVKNFLLNVANLEHDPSEFVSVDINHIKYEW